MVTFSVLQGVHERYAQGSISEQITVAGEVLEAFIRNRVELLLQSSFALSRDYAFQKAFSTNDRETMRSGLESLRSRVRADLLLLVGADGEHPVIVDTRNLYPVDQPFPFPDLIVEAEDTGAPVTTLTQLSGRLYNVAVVPLLAPDPIAWFCVGHLVDDGYMQDLRHVVRAEVSILQMGVGSSPAVVASTLPREARSALVVALGGLAQASGTLGIFSFLEERTIATGRPLGKDGAYRLLVQRSLDEAMLPFRRLQWTLWGFGACGLVLATIGIFLVARQVSRPVRALAEQARQVRNGEYGVPILVDQADEIGELGQAFNQMTAGLAEKERIHDLLGKVVSPAIAEELLRTREIQLGGEEREATILFSDIRNFTPLCEGRSPAQVLEMLNFYLTRMNAVIDSHGGVVDKFIGDAIMAIFGAPLRHEDDPDRALRAALDMVAELEGVKRDLRAQGFPDFNIGIGINTDVVMAGNMGSRNRLNYTVIGDGVNLASRLESASKELKHTVIVSAATLAKARGRYRTEPMGEVKVKGKSEAIRVFALLGVEDGDHARAAPPGFPG